MTSGFAKRFLTLIDGLQRTNKPEYAQHRCSTAFTCRTTPGVHRWNSLLARWPEQRRDNLHPADVAGTVWSACSLHARETQLSVHGVSGSH
jgi:hypothetical protein